MTASVEYKDGTSPNFDIGVSITLAKEGGFVCHPKDPGGATNMGITIKTARLYRVDENGDGVEEQTVSVHGTNLWLMTFGQFFDHGLDFLKRSSNPADVYTIPLKPGDKLYLPPEQRVRIW